MTVSVVVVGLHGGQPYAAAAAEALRRADLVVGSRRHLDATAPGRPVGQATSPIAGPLDAVVDTVAAARAEGSDVCVLASGDPGFFGIVRVLAARLGPEALEVHPAPSSVSLAFARMGRSWDDAAVISAHGRPPAAAVSAVRTSPATAVALLTAPDAPPELLAAALVAAGESRSTPATVASHLGDPVRETVVGTDLDGVAAGRWDPMSVLVVGPGRVVDPVPVAGPVPVPGPAPGVAQDGPSLTWGAVPTHPPSPAAGRGSGAGIAATGWGLDESEFDHRDGMITKAEVRAVVLARLALPPSGVLWDLGAGSGSVGVECARLAPGLRVVAVERHPDQAERVRANARRHGVSVEVVEGSAPAALAGLPDPDRVFVGGGGPAVLEAALARLVPGGTCVATFAVIDSALAAAHRLGTMVQISVSRAVPTGASGLRLRAEHPVFVCWGPPVSEGPPVSGSPVGA